MTATKRLLDMVDRQDFPAQGEEGNSLAERLHELVNAGLEEWECSDLLELFAAERQRTVLALLKHLETVHGLTILQGLRRYDVLPTLMQAIGE